MPAPETLQESVETPKAQTNSFESEHLVQKGIDRGRVDDIDLAMIGAKAEDESREAQKPITKRLANFILHRSKPDHNQAGEDTMVNAVYKPGDFDAQISANKLFLDFEQKRTEKQLATQGPETGSREADPSKLVIQKGVDAGRIDDIDLAMVGANAEEKARQNGSFDPDAIGLMTMSEEVGKRALAVEDSAENEEDLDKSKGYRATVSEFIGNQQETERTGKEEREVAELRSKLDDLLKQQEKITREIGVTRNNIRKLRSKEPAS